MPAPLKALALALVILVPCPRSVLNAASALADDSADAAQDASIVAQIESLALAQDERVRGALAQIEGTGRRLLALRGYLRAGPGLPERWSWSSEQIAAFATSTGNAMLQAEIDKVRLAFAAANPGYELWVNPEVRSLETQLASWNRNASVAAAADALRAAFRDWLDAPGNARMSADARTRAADRFLREYVPEPAPTLATPGLSAHGQMRAVDFQVHRDGKVIAGTDTSSMDVQWDAAGWTAKLNAAVRASGRFSGPLQSPREPWHYTYLPASGSSQ